MRELLRRYQFLLLAIVLMLATMVLYSYNLRQKTTTTFFERAVLTFTSPFLKNIDSGVNSVTGAWGNYLWLIDAQQQNQRLKQENLELRFELQQAQEVLLQNGRLRKLLAFVDELDRPALPAQVIGEDASNCCLLYTSPSPRDS